MLRRFCQVFKARFGFDEEVPEEVAKLSVAFRELVGKVPADTRVLLVIDALNQLDEADRAQELYWLPAELPPQVKVIVSCISDSGKTEPVLEAFRWRKHCPVQVTALSDAEQRGIIRQVPSPPRWPLLGRRCPGLPVFVHFRIGVKKLQPEMFKTPTLRQGDYPLIPDELKLLHCADFRDDAPKASQA